MLKYGQLACALYRRRCLAFLASNICDTCSEVVFSDAHLRTENAFEPEKKANSTQFFVNRNLMFLSWQPRGSVQQRCSLSTVNLPVKVQIAVMLPMKSPPTPMAQFPSFKGTSLLRTGSAQQIERGDKNNKFKSNARSTRLSHP